VCDEPDEDDDPVPFWETRRAVGLACGWLDGTGQSPEEVLEVLQPISEDDLNAAFQDYLAEWRDGEWRYRD
jgi:hypothetical protein